MVMTETEVLQSLIDGEIEKGHVWDKLNLGTLARAFPYMDNYNDQMAEKLKEVAHFPNKIFDGETWKRFCNILDNRTIYKSIIDFYSNKYEITLEQYGNVKTLESVRPIFLIVHSKNLKGNELYSISYKAKGHGTCIFVIINEFVEGQMS